MLWWRRLGCALALVAVLLPHPLLDNSQLLQLLGRENCLDLWRSSLPDLHHLLLFLLERHRVVITHSADLPVLVVYHRGDFLLLVRSQL